MSSDDALSKELEDFLDNTGIEAKPEPEPVVAAAVIPKDPPAAVQTPEPTGELEPPAATAEPAEPPEPPATPAPTEPAAPAGVEEPLTEREKLLMARLEEVTRWSLEAGADTPIAPASPVVPPIPVAAAPQPLNFIGDTKLDDILDSPEKFNAVLVDVYNKGIEAARKGLAEEIYTNVPKIVDSSVGRRSTMTAMVSDFYKENPDLGGVKQTVAAIANKVAAEDPSMVVDKVFEVTAERTRRVLGLPAKVAGTPTTPTIPAAAAAPAQPGSPAFVKQGSRRAVSTSGLKGLAAEVNELVSDNF